MKKFLVFALAAAIAVMFSSLTPADGLNERSAGNQTLTLSISSSMFKDKDTGLPLVPVDGDSGILTAQLFDEAGGGDPIWTEVQENFVFPIGGIKTVVSLGKKPFKNGEKEIQFNNSPFILLTYQVKEKSFVSTRFAIPVTGYSHQAGAAFNAVGDLKTILKNYEDRIKSLENANIKLVKKLYKEVYGEDPPKVDAN